MHHHISLLIGAGEAWQAKCSCRWRSNVTDRAEATAAMDRHQAQVIRAQAHLGTRNPSLRTIRAYYQEQAESPANTEDERTLWQQLADELDPFIKPRHDEQQLNLWE